MVMLAVKQSFKALQWAHGAAIDAPDIIKEAVRQHGWAMRYTS
jgi:hypothetical protein